MPSRIIKSGCCIKNPKNTGYLINLADAYEKDKKWHSAVNTYDKVVKVDKRTRRHGRRSQVLPMTS